jgi:hypothetical protein
LLLRARNRGLNHTRIRLSDAVDDGFVLTAISLNDNIYRSGHALVPFDHPIFTDTCMHLVRSLAEIDSPWTPRTFFYFLIHEMGARSLGGLA